MEVQTQNVYALILGGGRGTRLFPLTKDRAKPAVPIAGKFRLIDVSLSNCINSRIGKIFVLTQFNSESLHRHIHKTYRFDIFSDSFVEILAAEQTEAQTAWYQGTADAVRRNLWHLTDPEVDRVLILAGDQLYRMDFRDLLRTHADMRAEVTMVAIPKPPEQAVGKEVVKIDRHFRVVDFVEKVDRGQLRDLTVEGEDLAPLGVNVEGPVALVSMGSYLFNRTGLEFALDNEMTDFAHNVIPWCIRNMRIFVHPFTGYWEALGTIRSFYNAHMDLASLKPRFSFFEPGRPIYTHPRMLPSSTIGEGSELSDAVISEGAIIYQARIARCIIGVRSIIQEGSVLEESIVMGNDRYERAGEHEETAGVPARGIGKDCHIVGAIIDKNARIGDGVAIASHAGKPDEDADNYYVRDGVVIIPKNAVLVDGTRI